MALVHEIIGKHNKGTKERTKAWKLKKENSAKVLKTI